MFNAVVLRPGHSIAGVDCQPGWDEDGIFNADEIGRGETGKAEKEDRHRRREKSNHEIIPGHALLTALLRRGWGATSVPMSISELIEPLNVKGEKFV